MHRKIVLFDGVQEPATPFHRSRRYKSADRDDANKDLHDSVSLSSCRFDAPSSTTHYIIATAVHRDCEMPNICPLVIARPTSTNISVQVSIVESSPRSTEIVQLNRKNLTRPLSFFWHVCIKFSMRLTKSNLTNDRLIRTLRLIDLERSQGKLIGNS